MAHTADRRVAARANQLAAAFIRFQLLGDHEAMHGVLCQATEDRTGQLAFITALASIAGSVAADAYGRGAALEYLQAVAVNSGALSDDPDIDRHFDGH